MLPATPAVAIWTDTALFVLLEPALEAYHIGTLEPSNPNIEKGPDDEYCISGSDKGASEDRHVDRLTNNVCQPVQVKASGVCKASR